MLDEISSTTEDGPMEKRAIEAGKNQAARVIKDHRARRKLRQRAREDVSARSVERPERRAVIDAALLAELGPASTRVLVAEGDSWFDYPFRDVLSVLEDEHDYRIEAVSHRGDRIEDMAYSGGQLDKFVRTIENLIRDGKTPEAILVSGGGNDMTGDDFAMLLNHADSPTPGLNGQIVAGVVDERIRLAYITVLSAVTSVCKDLLGIALPILVHGYGYAVPDGRGYLGGWGPLPGPWLEPGFREKGYKDDVQRREIVKQLINRFNEMLLALPGVPGLEHVRHVDLRGTLKTDASYKDWWDNELHPTRKGYEAVAKEFARVLSQ